MKRKESVQVKSLSQLLRRNDGGLQISDIIFCAE